jgi:AcrR family transcriptional regulator
MSGTRQSDIAIVAERLFGSRGYHATTMREVARELDMKAGSLYAHIDSKEAVLADIVERAADAFDAAISPVASSDEPADIRLRAAIRAHLGVIAASRSAAAVYFDEWRHLSEPQAARITRRRDRYEAVWRGIIADGMARGCFASGDARMAALVCLSACNWTYQWLDPAGPMKIGAVAEAFAGILLGGLIHGEEAAGVTKELERSRGC